jgi:hypothetical protein
MMFQHIVHLCIYVSVYMHILAAEYGRSLAKEGIGD